MKFMTITNNTPDLESWLRQFTLLKTNLINDGLDMIPEKIWAFLFVYKAQLSAYSRQQLFTQCRNTAFLNQDTADGGSGVNLNNMRDVVKNLSQAARLGSGTGTSFTTRPRPYGAYLADSSWDTSSHWDTPWDDGWGGDDGWDSRDQHSAFVAPEVSTAWEAYDGNELSDAERAAAEEDPDYAMALASLNKGFRARFHGKQNRWTPLPRTITCLTS